MPCTTPGTPRVDRRPAGRLHPDQLGGGVDEAREDADGVGPPAHAGGDHVGIAPVEQGRALGPGLDADDPVELAHHPRVRVRAHDRARGSSGWSPRVATQSRMASLTASFSVRLPDMAGDHLGAQQAHAEHVEGLARRCRPRPCRPCTSMPSRAAAVARGHAVLAGTGLGHQAGLAHAPGQQGLAQHVVDLVRAGVVEVLALEQHPHAQLVGQPVALGQRRRPPGVVAQQVVQLGAEGRVGPRLRGTPASSSRQAGTSVSGTNRPPNSPKRPSAVGSPMADGGPGGGDCDEDTGALLVGIGTAGRRAGQPAERSSSQS